MGKQEICVRRETVDLERAIQYVEALTASLKAGAIRVQHGSEELTIFPGSIVDIKVDAYKKKEKEKISINLSWRSQKQIRKDLDFAIFSEVPSITRRHNASRGVKTDSITRRRSKKNKKAGKTAQK